MTEDQVTIDKKSMQEIKTRLDVMAEKYDDKDVIKQIPAANRPALFIEKRLLRRLLKKINKSLE